MSTSAAMTPPTPLDDEWGPIPEFAHLVKRANEARADGGEADGAVEPDAIYIYQPVVLPKATMQLFERSETRESLCEFCIMMQNVEQRPDGSIVRTICDCCRSRLSASAFGDCPGRGPGCKVHRFVDEFGAVAALCTACHQRGRRQGKKKHKPQAKKVAAKKVAAQKAAQKAAQAAMHGAHYVVK